MRMISGKQKIDATPGGIIEAFAAQAHVAQASKPIHTKSVYALARKAADGKRQYRDNVGYWTPHANQAHCVQHIHLVDHALKREEIQNTFPVEFTFAVFSPDAKHLPEGSIRVALAYSQHEGGKLQLVTSTGIVCGSHDISDRLWQAVPLANGDWTRALEEVVARTELKPKHGAIRAEVPAYSPGYLHKTVRSLNIPAIVSREAVCEAFKALGAKIWGQDVLSFDGKNIVLSEPEVRRSAIFQHATKFGFDATRLNFGSYAPA